MKPYIASIILAIFLLLLSPFGTAIILASGDTYYFGKDAPTTMVIVTLIITGILFMFVLVVQAVIAFIQHIRGHRYPFIAGILISWLPSAMFYTVFCLFSALTWSPHTYMFTAY